MNDKDKISRRSFLRGSIQAGGALMLAGALPVRAAGLFPGGDNAETSDSMTNDAADRLLQGVCDIHLHASPDSSARSVNEWGFAVDARRAGYRAVMFKSNDFSCHDRAYLIRQVLPDFEVFGSFCMNRVHGSRVNALPEVVRVMEIRAEADIVFVAGHSSAEESIAWARKAREDGNRPSGTHQSGLSD